MNNEYLNRVRQRINQRCAAKITEANRVADEQIKYLEFIQREVSDGAELMQAIDSAGRTPGWSSVAFQEEITNLMEEARQ